MTDKSTDGTLQPGPDDSGQSDARASGQSSGGAEKKTGDHTNEEALEVGASGIDEQKQSGADKEEGPPGFLLLMKQKMEEAAAKTALDLDACRAVVSRLVEDKEARVREQQESQGPPEPLKPFQYIDRYKQATPCSSKWELMSGTERVRFCEKCQLQVYDFTSIELPEAEELIFQRENRRDAVLYKRKDGKFLTSDCPAAVRDKQTLIIAIAATVILLVGLITLAASLPRPVPAPAPSTTQPVQSKETPAIKPLPGTKPAAGPRSGAPYAFPAPPSTGAPYASAGSPGTSAQPANIPYFAAPYQGPKSPTQPPSQAPASSVQSPVKAPDAASPGLSPGNQAFPAPSNPGQSPPGSKPL